MGSCVVRHPVTLPDAVPKTSLPTNSHSTIPPVSELIAGTNLKQETSPLQCLQIERHSDTSCPLKTLSSGMAPVPLYDSISFRQVPTAQQIRHAIAPSFSFEFPEPATSVSVTAPSTASAAPTAANHHFDFHDFGRFTSPSQNFLRLQIVVLAPDIIMTLHQPLPHMVKGPTLVKPSSSLVPAQDPGENLSYCNLAAQYPYRLYACTAVASLELMPDVLLDLHVPTTMKMLPVFDHNPNHLSFPSHVLSSYTICLPHMASQQSSVTLVSAPQPHPSYVARPMVYMVPYGHFPLNVLFNLLFPPPAIVEGSAASSVRYGLQILEQGVVQPYREHKQNFTKIIINQALVTQAELSKKKDISTTKAQNVKQRRTRSGCLTCRKRHIKCDERKPHCLNCKRLKRLCLGYDNSK